MLIRKRWWQPLWLGVFAAAVLFGRALNRSRDDWSGVIVFLAIITVAPAAFLLTRVLFRRHLRRWAAQGEWAEVDLDERRWPWQPPPGDQINVEQTRQPGAGDQINVEQTPQPRTGDQINVEQTRQPCAGGRIKVVRAWQREIDGLPVTFGEVRWKNEDFDGTVPRRKGSGAFVIVRLPQEQPPMTLGHTFQPVGESPRLDQPALFEAYVAGEIGPWAVRGDELFTIEPRDAWLDPQMADQAVRRALRTVQLLDLGPDTTSAEPR